MIYNCFVKEPLRNLKNYDVKNIAPKHLDSNEKLLLSIFLSMRNLDEIKISIEQLAWQASLGTATVKRKIRSLEKKGLLKRIYRKKNEPRETILIETKIASLVALSSPRRREAMGDFIKASMAQSNLI